MHPLIPPFDPPRIPLGGGLALELPGLLAVLGFASGVALCIRKTRRDGLDADVQYRLMPWIALAIILGGHLGEVLFYRPAEAWERPRVLLEVWSGQSAFGGFLACALLAVWFFRRENRRRAAGVGPRRAPIVSWAYADAYLYGFTFGWFVSRIGCFLSHDHPGVETRFWLGAYGACPSRDPTVACHDLGLYESLWSLAAFGVFTVLDRRPRFPGFFSGVLFVGFAVSRFPADFLRHPLADARYFGITPAQYGSIVMLALGIWILATQRSEPPVRMAASGHVATDLARERLAAGRRR